MTEAANVTPSDIAAQRIKAARKGKGWSARRLALECQNVGALWISESVVRNWETRGRRLTVDDVIACAGALEVPAIGLLPAYLDQNAEGINIEFQNPELLRDWLAALKVTLRGLHRLDPFLAQVEEPHHG
jgi:transcriptional regulator with XRE-family HTH domain